MTADVSPLGRRILLWGGGGKTTLSRALGAKLDLPVVELDSLFWLPNWVQREAVEFRQLVNDTIDEHSDGWVADGQYISRLHGDVLCKADTLIWVELPWRLVFWRTFRRAVRRARDRKMICGQNYETWRGMFFSRDSLLWWYIKLRLSPGWGRRHARREAVLAEFGAEVNVIRLSSRRELDDFYADYGLDRPLE